MSSLVQNTNFLVGAGISAAWLTGFATYKASSKLGPVVDHYFTASVELTSEDRGFEIISEWLTQLEEVQNLRHVSASINHLRDDDGETESKTSLLPQVGTTYIRYKGTTIKMERTRIITAYGGLFQTLKLSRSGWSKDLLIEMIDEAKAFAETRPSDKITIYKSSGCSEDWERHGTPKTPRPLKSLVLDVGIIEDILTDVREFLDSREWYVNRGVEYRRGYLLYGPPGCGKSSMIKVIAGELGYSICILNLNDKKLTDSALFSLMNIVPNKSIILMEDVDGAFKSRDVIPDEEDGRHDHEKVNNVTFSGLLNCLDGIVASEGRILFMTTNHISKLDPALIRPGRVDRKQHVTYPSDYQLGRIFKNFYPEVDDLIVKEFIKSVRDSGAERSMAELQGVFMLYKESPSDTIEYIRNLKDGEIV